MTRKAADYVTQINNKNQEQPYSPSWVAHLTNWMERRPGSSWLYYSALGLVLLFVQVIVLWIEGAFPIGTIDPANAYIAGAMAFMLALIHYLDKRAHAALTTMRPVLKANDDEYQEMSYRLITLPRLTTLMAGLAAIAFVLLTEAIGDPYNIEALAAFPVSANILRIFYLICWMIFGTFLYHTVHQLTVINHIYTIHTRIDLFRVKPLYAFSNITAITAGSLAMITYGWLIVNPRIDRTDPLVFIPMVILLLFALVTFIWPQMGIHRLQVAEKERLLDEATQRLETAIIELHRRLDEEELEGMTDLNMGLASLEIELNALRKTPTWPWEPEVLQLLITALALPLGLWLIQLILQRTLGT